MAAGSIPAASTFLESHEADTSLAEMPQNPDTTGVCGVSACGAEDRSPTLTRQNLDTSPPRIYDHGMTRDQGQQEMPADLQVVFKAWRDLPEAMKQGIVAIVEAVSKANAVDRGA